jgi:hypothetical protein
MWLIEFLSMVDHAPTKSIETLSANHPKNVWEEEGKIMLLKAKRLVLTSIDAQFKKLN